MTTLPKPTGSWRTTWAGRVAGAALILSAIVHALRGEWAAIQPDVILEAIGLGGAGIATWLGLSKARDADVSSEEERAARGE